MMPDHTARDSDPSADALSAELALVEHAFNRAMVSNDVNEISGCITDDWVLVTPEAGVIPRCGALHLGTNVTRPIMWSRSG